MYLGGASLAARRSLRSCVPSRYIFVSPPHEVRGRLSAFRGPLAFRLSFRDRVWVDRLALLQVFLESLERGVPWQDRQWSAFRTLFAAPLAGDDAEGMVAAASEVRPLESDLDGEPERLERPLPGSPRLPGAGVAHPSVSPLSSAAITSSIWWVRDGGESLRRQFCHCFKDTRPDRAMRQRGPDLSRAVIRWRSGVRERCGGFLRRHAFRALCRRAQRRSPARSHHPHLRGRPLGLPRSAPPCSRRQLRPCVPPQLHPRL